MKAGSWSSILLIYLYAVIGGGAIGKAIPLLPDMARTTGVGIDSAAWLVSAIAAASVLIAPFGGALSDKLGDRWLTAIGIAIMIVANIADWNATSFAGLLAARLLEGSGFIGLALGTTAMMARTTEGKRQTQAMALFSTAVPLGVGLSLVLAGQFAGEHWRLVFLAHAAVLIVMLGLLGLTPPWVASEARSDALPSNWLGVVCNASALRLATGIFIATIVMFGFGALFPTYAMETYGLSAAQAATSGLLSYPASVLGSLVVVALTDKLGIRNLILVSFTLLAVTGISIFLPIIGLTAALAFLFLFYLVSGMVGAFGMSRLPRVLASPDAMGMTTSLFIQASNLGLLIGAPVTIITYYKGGTPGMIALTIACAGAAFVSWYFQPKISGTDPGHRQQKP